MAEGKMTKREAFEAIIDVLVKAETENGWSTAKLVAVVEHEIDLLNRKRKSGDGQDAKRKAEQDAIKAKIASVLADNGEPMRAGDIATALADGTTIQRVSALVKQMVNTGEVARNQDKKVVTFTLA